MIWDIPGLPPPPLKLMGFFPNFDCFSTLRVHQWLYENTHCFNGGNGIPGMVYLDQPPKKPMVVPKSWGS